MSRLVNVCAFALVLIAAACSDDASTVEAGTTSTGGAESSTTTASEPWPPTGQPTAAPCPKTYPETLEQAQVAFDGTVTAVRLEEEVPKAGDRRASVDFDVHEVLRGNVGATQRMRTWTFFLPKDPQTIVGQRVLVSTGASTDEIESCGYSRPWSERGLVGWRRLFASREEAP